MLPPLGMCWEVLCRISVHSSEIAGRVLSEALGWALLHERFPSGWFHLLSRWGCVRSVRDVTAALPDRPLLSTRRPGAQTTTLGSVIASSKGSCAEECPKGVLQLRQLCTHGPVRS